MEERLRNAFVEGLGIDRQSINWEELRYRQVPEWDSVAHMQLVAEIEDEFEIMLDTDDVIGMSSFLISKEILTKYGLNFE